METSPRPIFTVFTRSYYLLTKPGIIMGNLVTTIGGFILASKGHINFGLLLSTLIGLCFVIASACVFNNYIDRNADEKMKRTKNRVLAKGLIPGKKAIAFAVCLGLFGTFVLSFFTNLITVAIALLGFFTYVILYSFAKYYSIHGTLIGSIAGAVPPVVGYCAVSGRFDLGALILFTVMALWQMPHFFSIAILHLKDYAAASIPVLPVKKGLQITKLHMMLYIVAFTGSLFLLTAFGYTNIIYLIATLPFSFVWLWICVKGFKCDNDKLWARKMFRFSLIVVMAISIAIPLSVNKIG